MSTGRPEAPTTPAVPKPAASVVLVRDASPGSPEPLEVYMIRRNRNMKFLGGYYAFPGGKVDRGLRSGSASHGTRGSARARVLDHRGARAPRGERHLARVRRDGPRT